MPAARVEPRGAADPPRAQCRRYRGAWPRPRPAGEVACDVSRAARASARPASPPAVARRAASCVADLRRAVDALDGAWQRLPTRMLGQRPDARSTADVRCATRSGVRLREVEVHHVDLDLGYTAGRLAGRVRAPARSTTRCATLPGARRAGPARHRRAVPARCDRSRPRRGPSSLHGERVAVDTERRRRRCRRDDRQRLGLRPARVAARPQRAGETVTVSGQRRARRCGCPRWFPYS